MPATSNVTSSFKCTAYFYQKWHIDYLNSCAPSTVRRNKQSWNRCRVFYCSRPHLSLSASELLKTGTTQNRIRSVVHSTYEAETHKVCAVFLVAGDCE